MCSKIFHAVVLFMFAVGVRANNVQITNLSYSNEDNQVTFDLSWENSWRSGVNFHDAIWLFVKYRPNNSDVWSHGSVTSTSVGGALEAVAQPDQVGVFIRNFANFSGDVAATSITLTLGTLNGPFPDIKVFGIEMVYVPEGPFYLGDGTSDSCFGTYSSAAGNIDGSYQVTSSGSINFGTTDGYLYSKDGADPVGEAVVPDTYPNGFDAFYGMKYEVTQEQYKEFLNCLSRQQQNVRTNTDISGTSVTDVFVMSGFASLIFRNSIRCEGTLPANGPIVFYNDLDDDQVFDEAEDGLGVPCDFLSSDDVLAFMDWCGLRLMTDLEYEKACRGSANPVAGEYAWGTTDLTEANTLSAAGTSSESVTESGFGLCNFNTTSFFPSGPLRNGFAAGASTNRAQSGGSYYGIMELSGNLLEAVFSTPYIGHQDYDGSLGDGELDLEGNQNAWNLPANYVLGSVGGGWLSVPGGGGSGLAFSVSTRSSVIRNRSNGSGAGRGVR